MLKKVISAVSVFAILGTYIFVPAYADYNTAPLMPTGLLTNELENPLNTEDISFSWFVNDNDFDEIQTAYQIVIKDAVTGEIAWDSEKVTSSEQSNINCEAELKTGYPYKWTVRTWDKDDEVSPESETASFATGLSTEDWEDAEWISSGSESANHYWYTRSETKLDNTKSISYAMGYFACIHDYELNVNGERIGRGQSFDYESETRYQGWDITDAVKKDDILTIGILARNYGGGQGRADGAECLKGIIKVYYNDGTEQTIVTDPDNWKVSTNIPLSGSEKRNGEGDYVEEYNATMEQRGYSESDFDDTSWSYATEANPSITVITPELSKQTEEVVYPVSVTKLSDGTTIADFGKVIPARPSIIFENGTEGRTITIQAGYVLKSDGRIDTSKSKTQDTTMTWEYTQKSGSQTYNAWDHLGFRYISIPSCGENFTVDTIAAKIVHTDVPEGRESTIKTSNEMLDNVYDLMKRSAIYSVQNNFVDTPTREKGQFLQDSINISEATVATQYERAASKKAIEQFIASADRYWTGENSGRINSVYPNCDGARDIPDFTINFPYWVWNYYMQTGDKELLEFAYPYVKNTADYIIKYIDPNTGLVTKLNGGDGSPNSYMYGIVDWPAAGRFGYDWNNTKEGARTTVNMLSKRAFDVTSFMAEELGYSKDKNIYLESSADLKNAINNKLLTNEGVYCDGLKSDGSQSGVKSQHSTSYALAFDVAPEDKVDIMSEYVAELGMKQGPMTADILLKGLINSGQTAAALKLLTEPSDYGWAKEIDRGYTFTFESWQANADGNSQSHGWGSTAAADILESFAGVTVTEPGASKVRIAPVYADLTNVDACVQTERGAVGVSYERDDNSYNITINIPANMKADVELPDIGDGNYIEKNGRCKSGTFFSLGSGQYDFTYDGEVTVLPEKVEYKEVSDINGFTGKVDAENKIYTYEIGTADICSAGTEYMDESSYVDLTVSMGKGDYMEPDTGINFTGASVGENNSLNDSKRYILVCPKTDGTFSMDIAFSSASNNAKNRVYYKEFIDRDSVDLASCIKSTGISTGDITSTSVTSKSIDMTAGHVYVIYTYQKSSMISNMQFAYEEEPEAPRPTETSSPSPTVLPSDEPNKSIKILNRRVENGTANYELDTNGIEEGQIVAVSYDGDNMYALKTESLTNGNNISIPISERNANVKIMIWDSLDNMTPLCNMVEDVPVESESDNILEIATTYSSISILWDKPDDYKNITGYNVYVNDILAGTVNSNETYYTADDLEPQSSYMISVRPLINNEESEEIVNRSIKTDVKGKVHNVMDAPYNAAGDGVTLDTNAIQSAIDACEDNDIVLIPENYTFLTGALDLKSNMTLEVNGTLLSSKNAEDFEKIEVQDDSELSGGVTAGGAEYNEEAQKRLIWSRSEGWEQYCYRSLINIGYLDENTDYSSEQDYVCTNVKICGTGTITGDSYRGNYAPINGNATALAIDEGKSADQFYSIDPNATDSDTNAVRSRIRGRLINISNAKNVYVKGVTVANPPMWAMHMIYSDGIITNGVTFKTSGYRNGDGWDPDSSTNCTIYNSSFSTGDDCIAIKSGKNPEGNVVASPSKNINVIGCKSEGGLGLAIGSEMSGGVEGVYVRDCVFSNTRYGLEIKANKVRGGYVKDVHVQDSTIDQILIHSVNYNADGEAASESPQFSDITFKNINIIGYDNSSSSGWINTAITLEGFNDAEGKDDYYIKNINFEDIVLGTENNIAQNISMKYCRNLTFNNVRQSNGEMPVYSDADSTFTVDGGQPEDIIPVFSSEIEAEKMNLHGYEYESNSAAFGGACVSANNSGNGTVKAEFGGESGKHDLTIYYFDENDGNAEFEFYINGNHITSWTADKDLGSASADIKTLTTYIIKDIELSKGDIISIVGRKEKYDPARLDRIVIDEEEATKPNDPTGITDDSIVWDFSAYTDEISATEENYTELYNGLTIALNSNGADSDHDSISSAGVYWRGGVSNGESTVRYISYTPEVDGILCASGKTANSDGAWGISISKDVSDLTSGSGKSSSKSEATVYMECKARTTYYIIPYRRAATISEVWFNPISE